MRRRLIMSALVAALLAVGIPDVSQVQAAPRAGQVCVKVGATSGTLICKRVKGKPVWQKRPAGTSRRPGNSTTAPAVTASDLRPGLVRTDYRGYHEDQREWFATSAPARSTQVVSVVDIQTQSDDYFSVRWTGYFVPTESGTWTFTTISDDGSYVWLGREAASASPLQSRALLSAPGIHGPVRKERDIHLIKGSVYPIRIHFGDAAAWAQMTMLIKSPSADGGGTSLTGLVWHSPVSSEAHSGIDPIYAESSASVSSRTGVPVPPTDGSLLSSVDVCRLADGSQRFETRRGFPRSETRLATRGSVRGIVLFVEFTDVKGDPSDIAARFTAYTEKTSRFYAAQSYGALSLTFDYYPQYLAIPQPSSRYGMDRHNAGRPEIYLRDALDAADPHVNFAPYDFVVVIPPTSVEKIVYGPAFPMPSHNDFLRTDEKVFRSATVAGSDSIRNGPAAWWWTSHELGHLFGLEHQYSWSIATYERIVTGMWDLMETGDQAPEFLAWHRFLMGWLPDESIRCMDGAAMPETSFHHIAPIVSSELKPRSVMIRLSHKEAIVVEVRRNMGLDEISEFDEGVLVYLVNTHDRDSRPTVLILTERPVRPDVLVAGTLKVGQQVTHAGVTVAVVASEASGDTIRVDRAR